MDIIRRHWIDTNGRELYALIGLLIFSGSCKSWDVPMKELFHISGHAIYCATMSVERAEQLLRFMRFDNSQTRKARIRTDKLTPVRDISNVFLDQLKRSYKPSVFLTVDE